MPRLPQVPMIDLRSRHALFAFSLTLVGLTLDGWAEAVPPRASDTVPDPGKGLTNSDDTTAIGGNPANLAFLPAPELRFGLAWMGSATARPNRGTSFALGTPLGPLATGLRLDLLDPPAGTGPLFAETYHWLRWAIAVGHPQMSFGTTVGWGFSHQPELDGFVSVTSGITLRPAEWLSAAVVARDWNEPGSRGGTSIERSFGFGVGVRPLSSRALELGFDLTYFARSQAFGGRTEIGFDVPRVGRLRGDLTVLPQTDQRFIAALGLEVNVDRLQVSGGTIVGPAFTSAGAGFYAGAALRAYQEPGIRLPAKVARITIKDTPSVRGNTNLLRQLWRLAEDPEIEGVMLEIWAEPASSLAHAEEVADAVRLLRAKGKKVMCHLEDAGGKSLFVCSQADRIAMNPAGGLRFAGLGSTSMYFGGLLKKLGVRADFVRIGAHKLGAEQLMAEGSLIGQRDHEELIRELTKVYVENIGAGRHIAPDDLERRFAKGPFIAPEARATGLVDTLAYRDELDRFATEVMGHSVRLVDDKPTTSAPDRWGREAKVAVVYLSGNMVDGESQHIPILGMTLAGSRTIARALQHSREDDSVKAVVFRIETGGGSSLAADVILREAILTARTKPLIVSMGSAAASGGYYAAVAGRTIYACSGTITGSIGIYYGKADVADLLDKIGVTVEQHRSSPRADAESIYRPFTDDERRELGVKVKQFYDLFVARVAEGRHMTPDAVDAVARGKVWTGKQGLTRGLVDRIGGLREALADARAQGGLPSDSPIVESPDDDDSMLSFLLGLVSGKRLGSATGLGFTLPPAVLSLAQILTPFLVFEANKPLARTDFALEGDFQAPSATGSKP